MSRRTERLAGGLIDQIRRFVDEHDVTYDDYRAVKQWLIEVGEAGEWPLFLDVFIESAVEAKAHAARPGTSGAIEGPYYLPGAPLLEPPYELPVRADEEGEPLLVHGRVTSADGRPLPGAVLDVWQSDAQGRYSGFSEIPDGILRGKVVAGDDGAYEFRTIRPAPYTIPLDGPTGQLVAACGWNPWRPAHIHLKVSADGYELLTTQLTLADSDYIDDDPARAVKPELIVQPLRRSGTLVIEQDFALAPAIHALAGPAAAEGAAGRAAAEGAAGPAVGPAGAARRNGRAAASDRPEGPDREPASRRRAWRPPMAAEPAPRFGAPRRS